MSEYKLTCFIPIAGEIIMKKEIIADKETIAKAASDCNRAGFDFTIQHVRLKPFIMDIDTPANKCGFFFNCNLNEDCENINNGYNCSHPEQEEYIIDPSSEKKIGCCHAFSCPLCSIALNREVAAQYPDLVSPDEDPDDVYHGDYDLVVVEDPEALGLTERDRW